MTTSDKGLTFRDVVDNDDSGSVIAAFIFLGSGMVSLCILLAFLMAIAEAVVAGRSLSELNLYIGYCLLMSLFVMAVTYLSMYWKARNIRSTMN